jgi:hypothetical protein
MFSFSFVYLVSVLSFMNLNLISKPLSLILYIITLMPKACMQSNFHTMIRQKEKKQMLSKKSEKEREKNFDRKQ